MFLRKTGKTPINPAKNPNLNPIPNPYTLPMRNLSGRIPVFVFGKHDRSTTKNHMFGSYSEPYMLALGTW